LNSAFVIFCGEKAFGIQKRDALFNRQTAEGLIKEETFVARSIQGFTK